MNAASYVSSPGHPQNSLSARAATLGSWAIGGAIFLTIGWLAVEPDDPLGAVSILTRSNAATMLIEAAALAVVASAMGAALAGQRRVDIGMVATALGLAAVSLRGSTACALLVDNADGGSVVGRDLPLKLALEAMAWFAVVALSLGVSAWVTQWCFTRPSHPAAAGAGGRSDAPLAAGFDVPVLGARLFHRRPEEQTPLRDGLKHTGLVTGVALVAMAFFCAGLSARSIQHGQVCFVVAAAVVTGSYVGHHVAPVRSALWSILAVPAIAVIGYVWASVRPAVGGLPAPIPASHFLRVLPIQYISVGTVAAVVMFWQMHGAYDVRHAPSVQSGGQAQRGQGPRG